MAKIKITALLENKTDCGLIAKHGLSLYIEMPGHKILFDLGPDGSFIKNAKTLGISIEDIDTVIISHGHNDHGGGLGDFLHINKKAKIYIQKAAFEKYYSKFGPLKIPTGLKRKLRNNPQIILMEGNYKIDEALELFIVKEKQILHSPANDLLFDKSGVDSFAHEQNLIIKGESFGSKNILITGCGHTGIVTIMKEAENFAKIDSCIGGFHLMNPVGKVPIAAEITNAIGSELAKYDAHYYTCHCTGDASFETLSKIVPKMDYLSCGTKIEF
jgi:7,8-dihydropterin-6-yl-methyl-4-(beta-D-ribofuranosyl)aminobenzene 5'-phosphate synthase